MKIVLPHTNHNCPVNFDTLVSAPFTSFSLFGLPRFLLFDWIFFHPQVTRTSHCLIFSPPSDPFSPTINEFKFWKFILLPLFFTTNRASSDHSTHFALNVSLVDDDSSCVVWCDAMWCSLATTFLCFSLSSTREERKGRLQGVMTQIIHSNTMIHTHLKHLQISINILRTQVNLTSLTWISCLPFHYYWHRDHILLTRTRIFLQLCLDAGLKLITWHNSPVTSKAIGWNFNNNDKLFLSLDVHFVVIWWK